MNRIRQSFFKPGLTLYFLVLSSIAALNMGGCPPELLDRTDALFGTNLNPPAILSVTPTEGPEKGGTRVTIRGLNFEEGTGVLFGNVAAIDVKQVNSNIVEATTPAGVPGPVTVTVIAGDRQSADFEGGFTYLSEPAAAPVPEPKPTITSVQPNRTSVLGGTQVTLLGSNFEPDSQVLFGGFLGTDVQVVSANQIRVNAPAQAAGSIDIIVRLPDGSTISYVGGFEYVTVANADTEIVRQLESRFPGGPRLVSAVATDNTSVQVTFSEPVSLASATASTNYSIVIPVGGVLLLDPAVPPKLNANQTVVDLTTLGMADAEYQLTVSGIEDLAGNSLAPPDILVNPSRTDFNGISPANIGEHIDSDGDGLADWFEMLGWEVSYELANGVRVQSYVTSSPFEADTDDDGLDDTEENARSLDPRTCDTDVDLVDDAAEIYLYASNPNDQDTDDDGFSDSTELAFKTSPTLADTDGDQLDDREELIIRNRNPRLADLPIPQIVIGTTNIEVDERFSYTDEMGVEQSTERSTSASFTQSDTTTFSRSNTNSTEATETYSQQIKIAWETGTEGWKFGIEGQAGFTQQRGRGYSATVSEESSSTAQEQYNEAQSEALAVSQRQSVSRSIENARVSADLTIVNAGDLAFRISNLEITARVKDPNSRDRYLPMATLLPASGNNVFNLGPAGAQRGPFIFQNTEIFPNLAQSLLREPRAMIFEIANFDIEDEYGRNFAFTLEEINDVTAGISIDFGDGGVESYRVATASTFDENGVARGIPMREALTGIIGLAEVNNEDLLPPSVLGTHAIRNSFGTSVGANGEQILTRVRGVQTDLNSLNPTAKFWVVVANTAIPDDVDFGDLILRPGDDYMFWYVQDADDDGLFSREEFMAGSSDFLVDTDGDGISDVEEIRTGWLTATPGKQKRVYSHPGRADSDLDGVDDLLERRLGMDPRSDDTDGDGLSDRIELEGYSVVLLDNDIDPNNNPEIMVRPYSDAAIIEPRNGGDGVVTTAVNPDSDDIQIVAVGVAVPAGAVIIHPGPDGIIDTLPSGDEFVTTTGPSIVATESGTAATSAAMGDVQLIPVGQAVNPGDIVVGSGPDGILQTMPAGSENTRVAHRARFATDPVMADSDADGLADGREEFLGARPNVRDADSVLDSDFDGLTNQQEMDGWLVGGVGLPVNSDPYDADSDNDGLPDVLEWALFTNPRLRDTDADGINDGIEVDITNPRGYFNIDRIDAAMIRCNAASGCAFTPAMTPVGTNPFNSDTDGDGLSDGVEINGWQVRVVGQPIKVATSDPFNANSDTDSLTDSEEYYGADGIAPSGSMDSSDATDPSNDDTDGDNVSDSVERAQNTRSDLVGSARRNPLRKDRLVKAGATGFNVVSNGIGAPARFAFRLTVGLPDQSSATLFDSTRFSERSQLGEDCDDPGVSAPCYDETANCGWFWLMRDGDSLAIPVDGSDSMAETFVVAEDDNFSIGGYITEYSLTAACTNINDFPLNMSTSFDYMSLSNTQDLDFTHMASGADVSLTYRVQVIQN
ncbi:MAG: IPT/TIG domain-containing protein [Phycisphaerales bacterium]|nr:IPT/TIG domain-containing protein [Phycisphaerales bacterium]